MSPRQVRIDTLPVLGGDYGIWDAGLPGLGVKVTPKGHRVLPGVVSACWRRLTGCGKCRSGPYRHVTLPMAKAQAQKIFAARLRWPRSGGGEEAGTPPPGGRSRR